MTRLLLVEDELHLVRSLLIVLREEGYIVDHAGDGERALMLLSTVEYEVLVLDLRLPRLGGLEVCRRLRGMGKPTCVLMLTACDATEEVVAGLDAGADDYLTKPFELAELMARVRALLRRGASARGTRLTVADLELDTRAKKAWRGGEELTLRFTEYRLLEHLARHAGEVQSKRVLSASLWEDELGPDSNALEVHVSNLRRKLDSAHEPKLLHTRRGIGYVLDAPRAR